MPRLFALFVLLFALALGGVACGSDDEESGGGSDEAPASLPQGGVDDVRVQGADDLTAKPAVKIPDRLPPAELEQADLVVGKGRAARKGDQLSVQYVGLAWSTAEQFDASWDSGAKPFDLELGAGNVIPGWDEGVAGMRVGGRRVLVVPPDKGYGAQGQPPSIGPNETLVFVIDLKSAK